MSTDAPPPAPFLPGWDFLKNLGAQPQPPSPFSGWAAPTVSIEEIDKRIAELKAVQFWIEQNGRALEATVQALQVQRMTLCTLKSMNVGMEGLAQAFQSAARPPDSPQPPCPPAGPPPPSAPATAGESAPPPGDAAQAMGQAALQWWGAMTEQFQQIALQAMREQTAVAAAGDSAAPVGGDAGGDAGEGAPAPTPQGGPTGTGRKAGGKSRP